ncbi:hypothetical protein [Sulfitobacter sp. UBA4523]|jgi:hypothetical protein|uniref:hypothetical protein n=1 Tax=Sulfitobacter sp. UBA4523 TaxID=1947584 RepID=UPI00257C56F3|nr:hypothetical protein [Sulfitobacter sp. UBA4523]|tara:strand:- start:6129 stop:6377 length:249 start_codon:yes stop_codon:yes gene_type:complete
MSVDTFLNPLSLKGRASSLCTWVFGLCINNPHPTTKGEHYVQNGDHIIEEGISEKPASNATALAETGQSAAKAALTWWLAFL